MNKFSGIYFLMGISMCAAMGIHYNAQKSTGTAVFWDSIPHRQASYVYAPGVTGSEFIMGRYCPQYTASTGEKISWKSGGHVIGQPHSAVNFPDANLKKPDGFTLNPFTSFTNSVRRGIFPLAKRYFDEKYQVTVEDNPASKLSVFNYFPRLSAANIGQQKDINALRKVYTQHCKFFPESDIVLYGDSRGAATIFNFLALYNAERVKAAVLEAVFDTVPHAIKHFLYEDKSKVTEACLHQLLSWTLWSYRKNGANPRKSAEIIGDTIPLLFVTSLKDGLVAAQCTINLYRRLVERGHKKVHLLVLKKSYHATYMIDDPADKQAYESVVHAFYKHYGLPHNSTKAAAAQHAFADTQPSPEQLKKLYVLAQCELCK
jgi:hypothetical protein